MISAVAVKYNCVRCGAETDWDQDYGDEPICAVCWDQKCEKEDQDHKAGAAASRRGF